MEKSVFVLQKSNSVTECGKQCECASSALAGQQQQAPVDLMAPNVPLDTQYDVRLLMRGPQDTAPHLLGACVVC